MTQRSKRPSKTKPILLTKRDRDVFRAIASFRSMTAEQLQILFFHSLARARRRLRALWQAGFLRRSQRAVRQGEGSSRYFYALTMKTCNLLKQEADHMIVLKASRQSEVSLHTEKINDFRICLEAANRSHNPELSLWKEGNEIKMTTHVHVNEARRPISVVPDALFTLKLNNKEYSYYLEIDRGTTDLSRLVLKLQGYANLFGDKVPQRTFNIKSFRVLLVTTTRTRIENLAVKLSRLGHRIPRLDLFCFLGIESVTVQTPSKLFEPVWLVIGSTGKLELSRPLPSLPPSTFPLMSGKPPVH